MRFQLKDTLLQISYFSNVVSVGPPGDEPNVTRFVAQIDIDAIQLQLRIIPTIKRDQMREKPRAIFSPRGVNPYAAPPVVVVPTVVGVVAAVEASGYAVAQATSVIVVWADVRVAEPALCPFPSFTFGAAVAPRGGSPPNIVYVHTIRPISTRAFDQNGAKAASWAKVEPNDFKLADPVANARAR